MVKGDTPIGLGRQQEAATALGLPGMVAMGEPEGWVKDTISRT